MFLHITERHHLLSAATLLHNLRDIYVVLWGIYLKLANIHNPTNPQNHITSTTILQVGHAYFIRLFHIGRARVVAADPGSQPGPRVGPDGQGCPIQSAEGLVFPKQILAPVRGEEGVRHPKFEHAELGPGLQVKRLPDVKFER